MNLTLASDVERVMAVAAAEGAFSGCWLVAQRDTELASGAVGLAHRGFQVPNTIDTRFDIASITKVFTAVAIMQGVARGDYALDTPVMPYLGITGTRISDDVRVEHCLTHTSGIGDDADEEAGESYEALFQDKPNYSLRETVDFLPQFVHKEPYFAPGDGVRYNNVAWILLGLMIEQSIGMPCRDYVQQHVFSPAGMTGADFYAMDGMGENLAEHYVEVEGGSWRKNIYSYPPIGSPDGGATVSVRNLHQFVRSVTQHRLLDKAHTEALLQPRVQSGETPDGALWNAFGTVCRVSSDALVTRIAKDGGNAGVASVMAWYPPSDTTIVLLANIECSVWNLLRKIESIAGV